MGNAKPVRERSRRSWLSVGAAAGGVAVAVALTVFIVLAVSRAGDVESSGGSAPTAAAGPSAGMSGNGTVQDRSVVLAPGANGESAAAELPAEGAPAEGAPAESDAEVRRLGGADSVSVLLGSVVADEPAGAGTVEPLSQLTDASLRVLYPAAETGNGREHGTVLTAVVEHLMSNANGDGPGEPDTLPTAPLRRDYVNRAFQELIAEVGAVDRVYHVLDGTDGAHMLLRNGERQWWSVWLAVSAGEIIDIEYRDLSGAETSDRP